MGVNLTEGNLTFAASESNYTKIIERCDMMNVNSDLGLPILFTHQAWHHKCG